VAEGIAGSTPPTQGTAFGYDRSFLLSLSEAGQQSVMVTGAYKKSVPLMSVHANPKIRHLDEVVTATAACDNTITWQARYLVDKAAEQLTVKSLPPHPTNKTHP
jgi:hypothetical protein